ncbi:hypothetical protein F2Q69_00023429 [Brassica cretica]|uniref:Uncharacterized protein n=1 Tax=Brassica cretica TaxID=69181 RepID=A0A8S9Q983_BRACR|nr:hypothetical protein F2Q69_00023429 [Brassica cretica]
MSSEDYSNPKDSIFLILIPECEDDDFHEERQQNRATPSSDDGSSTTPSRRNNRRKSHNNNNPSFLHLKPQPHNQIHLPIGEAPNPLPPRSSSSSASVADASREEQWRLAVAELSHKLIQATKKKEDAVTEASRLKTSMTELEKKLNKLEIYYHNLKSGLDERSNNNKKQSVLVRFNDGIIQQFLVSVSESRSSIRALSRALASQTRNCHFSEEFNRFYDRKNECHIASMLCWNRTWPGPLLQAFFGASKNVWLVHLLVNSLNPGLQIFRVERDDRFDPVYKEETGGDRYKSVVRAMVQPGFYVYGSVVKCKVVCKHCGSD